MNRPRYRLFRKAAAAALATGFTLILSQCQTTSPSVAVSGDLATPHHSLPKSEYPFDDQGNYREDWVNSSSGSSRRSSSTRSTSTSLSSSSSNRSVQSVPTSSSRSGSSSSSTSSSSSSRDTASVETPKETPAEPAPRKQMYHTVSSGDTLWSISRRYGVSVTALKQENGLKSDLIRAGDNLRIP